jgi:DNA-binding NarL/FixJ family response regulator
MENPQPIKVTLYDDSSTFRCSLSKLFGLFDNFKLIGAYPNACQIVENCTFNMPDVILMDIDMPGISGIKAAGLVRAKFPYIKVVMLTVFEENDRVLQSICNGAVGYILKKTEPCQLLEAVKEANDGGAPMTNSIATKVLQMFRAHAPVKEEGLDVTDRERMILTLLTKGYSYKMIATECNLSIDTVRFYIKKIYEKLQVHSMTEAVSKALKNKWVN